MSGSRASRVAAAAALIAIAVVPLGCGGDPCEGAAQICADEQRVGALIGDSRGVTCEGELERHAECIEEAESCAPDVVDGCWESAAEAAAP